MTNIALDNHLHQITPQTLPELLARYNVTIPGIQRHYVQGGDDAHAKEVRAIFITDILNHYLKQQEIHLDFLFGPLDTNGADTFIPVDGQQRLTTLWLLTRYTVERLPRFSQEQKDMHRTAMLRLLARFQYADRRYASRFCKALTTDTEEMSKVNWVLPDSKPSYELAKQGILNPGWRTDSTVKAMLNTLDTIHEIWNKLLSDSNAEDVLVFLWEKVTFQLCMKHFPDDLYMKMNARGLTLTQWEKVKGKFASHFPGIDWASRIEVLSNSYFEKMNSQLPDNAFFTLIGRIAVYLSSNTNEAETAVPAELAQLASCNPVQALPYVPFDQFFFQKDENQPQMRIKQEDAATMLRMMEYLLGHSSEIHLPEWDGGNPSLLDAVFIASNEIQRTLSLVLFEYFRHFENPAPEAFNHSLRLFWNVLNNVSGENTLATLSKAIQNSVEPDLYKNPNLVFESNARQYIEEKQKVFIYLQSSEANGIIVQELHEAEAFLHGRVRLALLNMENMQPCVSRTRMQMLVKLHNAWSNIDVKNRRHLMLLAVAAMPYWQNPYDHTFILGTNDDALRNLLTKNVAEANFQVALLDWLSGRDLVQSSPNELLAHNPERFDEMHPQQQNSPRRDWRQSILRLAQAPELFCLNISIWDKTVKFHGSSDCHYLFLSGNIRNALPLGDYRVEIMLDKELADDYKKLGDNFQDILMNDSFTHSGFLNEDLLKSLGINDTNGNNREHVYFYPFSVQIVSWYRPGTPRNVFQDVDFGTGDGLINLLTKQLPQAVVQQHNEYKA